MSNRVSYNIQFRDRFSRVAERARRSMDGIQQSATRASASMARFSRVSRQGLTEFGRSARHAGAVMTATVTLPLALMGKSFLDAASNAQETGNLFEVVFAGINEQANQSAKALMNYGKLAKSTAQGLVGTTGDLLAGFGFDKTKALDMSNLVNKMAVDYASFKNVTTGIPGASEAITRAMLGETEMLKERLKIAVSLTSKDYNRFLAMQKSKGVAENMARAMYVLMKVEQDYNRGAAGDFLRTQDTYANLLRTNSERMKEFKEGLGKVLLPTAEKTLVKINEMLVSFNGLSEAKKRFIVYAGIFAAVLGPIVLIAGALAAAIGAIGAVGMTVIGVITAIGLALVAAKMYWGDFVAFIEGTASALYDNTIQPLIDGMEYVLNKMGLLDMEKVKMGDPNAGFYKTTVAPTKPNQSANIEGTIQVEAKPGTSAAITSFHRRANNMRMGVNMAGS